MKLTEEEVSVNRELLVLGIERAKKLGSKTLVQKGQQFLDRFVSQQAKGMLITPTSLYAQSPKFVTKNAGRSGVGNNEIHFTAHSGTA